MNEQTVLATLTITDLASPLSVLTLRGTEAMSALYAFELLVGAETTAIDFEAVIGKTAQITLTHQGHERFVRGIVCAFEQTDTKGDVTRYQLEIVPEVWLLAQGKKSRIFQAVTTAQILSTVLTEAGLTDHEISLQGTYEEREVCVQYGESDWDFLARLMAEEGIFYYFRHEQTVSKLVIADHTSAHATIGDPEQIAYKPASDLLGGESIQAFRFAGRIRPGKVTLREVPFYTPTQPSQEEASASQDTDVQVYAYAEGTQAKSRLDAYQVERTTARGQAASVRLYPGATFQLTGHPRASFDAGYVVTSLEHAFSRTGHKDDDAYSATFQCVPEATPCRPAARPKPRIAGPQSARVVGPEGAEIHVDTESRVLVKLEWDTEASDLTNACWVHVSQSASGASFGHQTIPRVGSYVLVEFLNGDPDRPILTGRVYNSVNPYPYPFSDNKTKSAIKTRTTPGGDGHSELRFDDQSGAEQVYLRAQRALDVEVLADATRTVGGNDTLTVGGDRKATITGLETETVGLAQTISIGAAQAVSIGAAQSVLVAGNRSLEVGGDHVESISGDHTETVAGARTTTIAGGDEVFVGDSGAVAASEDGALPTAHKVVIYGSEERAITGDQNISIAGNHTLSVQGTVERTIDGAVSATLTSLDMGVTSSTAFLGTGEVKIESGTSLKLGGPYIYVSADNILRVRAYTKIVLEVAASDDDDDTTRLEITADGIYLTNGSATEKLSGGTVKLNC